MRIAMVSEHASPLATLGGADAGGQNVHVAELSRALAARGHEVAVHTRADAPDLPAVVEAWPGVRVEHVVAGPPAPLCKDDLLPLMPEFARVLAGRWRHAAPDVVHAHFWMSGMAAVAAAGELALPVLQTFHALGAVKRRHQGAADTSDPRRCGIERRLLAEVDRIVATCSDEVFELRRLGADRRKVAVAPCGVDASQFTPDGPAAARGESPRLLVVGRLVPRKGVDDAIRALRFLPGAELVVVGGPTADALGSDPEALRLHRVAAEAGVAHQVRFVGRVAQAEMPAVYRSADAVICAPWYEPFGIVPLEAMACGVPVVATAVGGLIDTVVDGVTGRHVHPKRPDEIAAAVRDVLDRGGRRSSYAVAGRARVEAMFTWQRVAELVEQQYVQVLGERNAGHRLEMVPS